MSIKPSQVQSFGLLLCITTIDKFPRCHFEDLLTKHPEALGMRLLNMDSLDGLNIVYDDGAAGLHITEQALVQHALWGMKPPEAPYSIPPYAIHSHRWVGKEVTFQTFGSVPGTSFGMHPRPIQCLRVLTRRVSTPSDPFTRLLGHAPKCVRRQISQSVTYGLIRSASTNQTVASTQRLLIPCFDGTRTPWCATSTSSM